MGGSKYSTRWRRDTPILWFSLFFLLSCYIPVYLPGQEAIVRAILGADWEDEAMYQRALASARWEMEDVEDNYAWFNLGEDYLAVGKYGEAADAYGRALASLGE
jgi:tetratricopeptide (TPR) repeat protein